ncbi:MAG TPA: response regulator transcription factor [Terriglobales bacterium]|nr:response regulator transcription factor [Terriglobales bacterium]
MWTSDFGGRHQQLGPVRILVVDDFEPWRRSIISIIEADPELQVIHEASDGVEAVQMGQELQPDLVVLDVGLPKLCGLEAARRIRVVSPDSKILFLSVNPSQDVMREALRIGAGFIAKADVLHDLLPAVRAAVADQEFLRFTILPEAQTDLPEE